MVNPLDSVSHVSLDGKRFGAVLSLSLLNSINASQREALRSFGINTLGELLRWEPVHRARLLVASADGKLAHDVDTSKFIRDELADLSVKEIVNRDPEVLDGIGASYSHILQTEFDIVNIRSLADWEPYIEAERLVSRRANEFSEPRSAPDELIPATIGVTVSTARYSSFVKDRDIGNRLSLISDPNKSVDPTIEAILTKKDLDFRIGLGYILAHRQHWKSAGVGLGEPVHSLGLAPGETRKIAIVDWRRRAIQEFSERTEVSEYLASTLARRRALDEVTRAVAAEHQSGQSTLAAGSSVTAGSLTTALSAVGAVAGAATLGVVGSVAGGGTGALTGLAVDLSALGITGGAATVGLGLAGSIAGGVAGTVAGAAAGGVAGAAAANLIVGAAGVLGVLVSDSKGNRNIVASLQSRLADSTVQKSSNLRGIWSTIITEDDQTESEKVQSVSITNYNHAHALTIQYYELLQRYHVETVVEETEPFIALPYQPFDFNATEVLEKYWDILRLAIEDKELMTNIDEIISVKSLDEVEEPAAAGGDPRLREVEIWITHPMLAGKPNVYVRDSAGNKTRITHRTTVNTTAVGIIPILDERQMYVYSIDNLELEAEKIRQIAIEFPHNAPRHDRADEYIAEMSAVVKTTAGSVEIPRYELGKFTRTAGAKGAGAYDFPFKPIKKLPSLDTSSSDEFRALKNLKRILVQHRYRFTQIILNATEAGQLRDVLDEMVIIGVGAAVPLKYIAETRPIGITDQYILLPLNTSSIQAIRDDEKIIDSHFLQSAQAKNATAATKDQAQVATPVGADIVKFLEEIQEFRKFLVDIVTPNNDGGGRRIISEISLPTAGVFAEAIQGSANSAELIDLRRNIAWHEMPIPIQAPDILAIAMGSRFQDLEQPDPNIPDSELEQQQPPSAADPGAALTGILAAIQNGNMFRDMSNAGTLASTLSSLANVANQAAATSGRLSGEALETTLKSALDLANRVSEASSALAGQNLDSLTRLGGNLALPDVGAAPLPTPAPVPSGSDEPHPTGGEEPKPKPTGGDAVKPRPDTTVQLEITAFVPAEAWFFPAEIDLIQAALALMTPISTIGPEVLWAALAYSGDDLPAGGRSARVRAALDLQIGEDTNGRLTIKDSSVRERFFGRSKVYPTLLLNDAPGRPDWIENVGTASSLAEFKHKETDDSLSFTAAIENGEVVARFHLNAQFYLPPASELAPDLSITIMGVQLSVREIVKMLELAIPNCAADIAVHVFKSQDGRLNYRLEGTHDQFPWYDVQINGNPAHSFDPEVVGSSPNALFIGGQTYVLPTDVRALPPL